jgi:hypothetical protein
MPKISFSLILWFPMAALIAAGQTTTTTGYCDRAFEAEFPAEHAIRMHLRSGEVRITGSDRDKVTVSCELKDSSRAREVGITFKAAGKAAEAGYLRVTGGPTNDFRLLIQVPRNSNLQVRAPAGDVTVEGVTGDKDVELHAGNLVIAVGNAADYRRADASLMAGDLTAPAFDVEKGGLFRSFEKNNPGGKYLLHAHVAAGEITLRN